ncbi:hypothetical protein RYX36_035901 [Vicia faba]
MAEGAEGGVEGDEIGVEGKAVDKEGSVELLEGVEVSADMGEDVPMAPLWDYCKSQFVGVLSEMDFILLLKEVCG